MRSGSLGVKCSGGTQVTRKRRGAWGCSWSGCRALPRSFVNQSSGEAIGHRGEACRQSGGSKEPA